MLKLINNKTPADIGDYMKVFACTAVMMQSVLSLILTAGPDYQQQLMIGFLYNLVKFTAPVFIFGILYTTTRTSSNMNLHNYPQYFRTQWSALFVPTIWWTTIYLLVMPNIQLKNHYTDLTGFFWQFINGNAAPHLWYNTMMLQFILIMPLFWLLTRWLTKHPYYVPYVIIISLILFSLWIWFYDKQIFHGPHEQTWYLLDRVFLSFFIYGIFGSLAWTSRVQFEPFIKKSFLLLVIIFCGILFWTNSELFAFGFPIHLENAPYYKASMTLYSLVVIGLIAFIAIKQIQMKAATLPWIHFLATYAYRAYLSNVFWLQLVWQLFGKNLAHFSIVLSLIISYLFTWILSFASAVGFHLLWNWLKRK
ncbi:acyltransferase family protein [Companilactobacillus furfuricola]|uniref:acyltransferase family protein n=1 Tax=Companilactobacillus furfuricola TaxID=1462575 RepID=UPI000F79998C|nr:acyltransferase [Companilactobacillus furfuricola]